MVKDSAVVEVLKRLELGHESTNDVKSFLSAVGGDADKLLSEILADADAYAKGGGLKPRSVFLRMMLRAETHAAEHPEGGF